MSDYTSPLLQVEIINNKIEERNVSIDKLFNLFAETLSVLPLESSASPTTTTSSASSSLFLSTLNQNNSSTTTTTTPTPTENNEKTSSNSFDIDHTTKKPNTDEMMADKKMAMNSTVEMKNQPVPVSMEKIFDEDDDGISMTNNKPAVNSGGKEIDENDDSNVPLVAMTKQADIKGRALSLSNEVTNGKGVEMINYVTTQSSVTARGMEDLSDVSMDDDDDEDSMHDIHTHNEDTKIDVNECIDNGKRYKVR